MDSSQSLDATVPPAPPLPLEARIRALGLEIFQRAGSEKESIWERDFWMGQVLELALRNPVFKTRMFQFVDVFPALRSNRQIAGHVGAYFSGDGALPLHLPQSIMGRIGGEGLFSGVTSALVAKALRSNILSMAERFILAESPAQALPALAKLRRQGLLSTVDLLGEKTVNEQEAADYQRRYLELLDTLAGATAAGERPAAAEPQLRPNIVEPRLRPNVSVKLSALCSRVRAVDAEGSVAVLKERLRPILRRAVALDVFVNLDMETVQTREIATRVFEELLTEPELAGSDQFGLVIQAYLTDALPELRRFIGWCRSQGRRFTVRLVKGAYWDYETVLAHQNGWPSPVYEEKWRTDANFEACLRLMMEHHDAIRLAVGSHNVRSLAVTLALAEALGVPQEAYEFQMLYGMGDPLKRALLAMGHPVRIYAPVGELLQGMAYLVRRLLENTSNESFLRRRFAEGVEAEALLRPPAAAAPAGRPAAPQAPAPFAASGFRNAPLLDFALAANRARMRASLAALRARLPLRAGQPPAGQRAGAGGSLTVCNPADPAEVLGQVPLAGPQQADAAVLAARAAAPAWAGTPAQERARILRNAARLMDERRCDLAALIVLEVGKSWQESDGDVVEAIDFLAYYAAEMERLAGERLTQPVPGESNHYHYWPKGVAVVIAPWNFPLSISTGMTAAALVTGNAVIYKPAEASTLTGLAMVDLLHEAGVPAAALTALPGWGEEVGARLVAHPDVNLIAFTGSREVGLAIIETAARMAPGQRAVKKVIAEMGGKNAIIVDEDADLDEATRGILQSAFGFQGQKCSACSRLIVLEGVLERLLARLVPAVEELRLGPPEHPASDVGPLIERAAQDKVRRYIALGEAEGRVLARAKGLPATGWYVPPVVFGGIAPDSRLAQEEIFGPVLVVLPARDFDQALELANGTEYCLTGGVYSRHPEHLQQARRRFRVGNLYLNRGITGAIVERQPFGGFGMSGVGSKAGGPDYLLQFMEPRTVSENTLRQGFAPAGAE